MELKEKDLTRNALSPDFKQEITYNDGLVASLHPRTREFITSPNCFSIPKPPFGSTRDLYRRKDGLYGEDDPIQWPQPINTSNLYLTCIPRFPSSDNHPYVSDSCMWSEIDEKDLDFSRAGRERKEGTLDVRLSTELQFSIDRLRNRTSPYIHQGHTPSGRGVVRLLTEFDNNITMCLTRVTSSSMSLRDVRRGLAELRRNWMYSVALLDFTETLHSRLRSTQRDGNSDAEVENWMGAFVWNDTDAIRLYNANLPVYYIQPYNTFDRQVIQSVKPLSPPDICMATASPPYPITLPNCQAGSDEKFAAIRAASISCFDVQSPFENMHLPGDYVSSFSLSAASSSRILSPTASLPSTSTAGPIRNRSSVVYHSPYSKNKETRLQAKKGSQSVRNASQSQSPGSRFDDLVVRSPFLLPLLPTCKGVNAAITLERSHLHHNPAQPPRLTTIAPDPALIFSTPDEERRMTYLKQWSHCHGPWLSYCRDSEAFPEAVSAGVWKKVLSIPVIGVWKSEKLVKSNQDRDHRSATQLLNSMFSRQSRSAPITYSPSYTISPLEGRSLVQELTFLNFRYQLLSLDELANQTAPKPAPTLSAAELKVLVVNHRRSRREIVSEIFGNGGDILTISHATSIQGFSAEPWSSRLNALRAFWKLMTTWPGDKDAIWSRGEDPNLLQLVDPGKEWERLLFRYYAQTYFSFFGHPPILPRVS
ncbi:hypothetical protein E1B28_006660 [Marasmius oreades]|uniref:Uncharacterized protein n=1 Tax=Marasmius oreades TaxID=181124 RepID=A0A9P7UWL7_9AGAR|nr:uncharacterized protein E1B28_006660 [Marasmius oreades]KAG7095977.1 hypothetical protein E1B28_006660 [Marasmius oreades]